MAGFNIIGLDANYNIVSLLRPTNLQWNRKYHKPGTFSIQIPIDQYSPDIKFIYAKNRPETGRLCQQNYISQKGYRYMHLSGFFCENELNRHICYPKAVTNITNSPAWAECSGKAEDVAYAFFEGFKNISIPGVVSSLGIEKAVSKGRGKKSVHGRNGECLGTKIYNILKPSGMSYRVLYDFVGNIKTFEVWSGIDRTEGNIEKNNPIVFSTKYGNIKDPNILLSDENAKNACLVTSRKFAGNSALTTLRAVFSNSEDEIYSMTNLVSSQNSDDYGTEEKFLAALDAEGLNYIEKKSPVINVTFDALEGSYEYLVDFDLGDKCTLEIPEMHLSAEARLIGCYEVMKSGRWSMSMEFGTPIINI